MSFQNKIIQFYYNYTDVDISLAILCCRISQIWHLKYQVVKLSRSPVSVRSSQTCSLTFSFRHSSSFRYILLTISLLFLILCLSGLIYIKTDYVAATKAYLFLVLDLLTALICLSIHFAGPSLLGHGLSRHQIWDATLKKSDLLFSLQLSIHENLPQF